ncbi:hypothetical protein MFRU_007g03210 [Monilinia fructicola]|nr:hypothetical protein MFRU_007g03210 [Monilinia fructicola]
MKKGKRRMATVISTTFQSPQLVTPPELANSDGSISFHWIAVVKATAVSPAILKGPEELIVLYCSKIFTLRRGVLGNLNCGQGGFGMFLRGRSRASVCPVETGSDPRLLIPAPCHYHYST